MGAGGGGRAARNGPAVPGAEPSRAEPGGARGGRRGALQEAAQFQEEPEGGLSARYKRPPRAAPAAPPPSAAAQRAPRPGRHRDRHCAPGTGTGRDGTGRRGGSPRGGEKQGLRVLPEGMSVMCPGDGDGGGEASRDGGGKAGPGVHRGGGSVRGCRVSPPSVPQVMV